MIEAAHEEWARAMRCLDSAVLLLKSGDPDSAVSRAYYSAFHGVSAFFFLGGASMGSTKLSRAQFIAISCGSDACP